MAVAENVLQTSQPDLLESPEGILKEWLQNTPKPNEANALMEIEEEYHSVNNNGETSCNDETAENNLLDNAIKIAMNIGESSEDTAQSNICTESSNALPINMSIVTTEEDSNAVHCETIEKSFTEDDMPSVPPLIETNDANDSNAVHSQPIELDDLPFVLNNCPEVEKIPSPALKPYSLRKLKQTTLKGIKLYTRSLSKKPASKSFEIEISEDEETVLSKKPSKSFEISEDEEEPEVHNKEPANIEPEVHNKEPANVNEPEVHNKEPDNVNEPEVHNEEPANIIEPEVHNEEPATVNEPETLETNNATNSNINRKPRRIFRKHLEKPAVSNINQKRPADADAESSDSSSSSDDSGDEYVPERKKSNTEMFPKQTRITIMRKSDHVTKIFPCGFCLDGSFYTKVQLHFRRYHDKDPNVTMANELLETEMDENSTPEQRKEAKKSRAILETTLLNASTFLHNRHVMQSKIGILCPVRLPDADEALDEDNFVFCPNCNGLYKDGKNYRLHVNTNCKLKTRDPEQDAINMKRQKLSRPALKFDRDRTEEMNQVLSQMHIDDEYRIIKHDKLILYVGQLYLDRKARRDSSDHVRSRMRYLARAVSHSGESSLSKLLMPNEFRNLCRIVKEGFRPCAQLKMGIFLKKAAKCLQNIAILEAKPRLYKAMTNTLHFFESEWCHRVGHQALLMKDQYSFNKVDILPLTRDVLKIRNHLDQLVSSLVKRYEKKENCATEAKKALACKGTVFNKRRGMEFVNVSREEVIAAMNQREENANLNEIAELQESLSPIEKHLQSVMRLLRLKGKMGKPAAVLLEPDDYKLLQYLIEDPTCQKDYYLFQSTGNRPYRGHRMLETVAKELNLERQDVIR